MPITPKGEKIMKAMMEEYGMEKGKQVFYASERKGKIKGVKKKGRYVAITKGKKVNGKKRK